MVLTIETERSNQICKTGNCHRRSGKCITRTRGRKYWRSSAANVHCGEDLTDYNICQSARRSGSFIICSKYKKRWEPDKQTHYFKAGLMYNPWSIITAFGRQRWRNVRPSQNRSEMAGKNYRKSAGRNYLYLRRQQVVVMLVWQGRVTAGECCLYWDISFTDSALDSDSQILWDFSPIFSFIMKFYVIFLPI